MRGQGDDETRLRVQSDIFVSIVRGDHFYTPRRPFLVRDAIATVAVAAVGHTLVGCETPASSAWRKTLKRQPISALNAGKAER
jgi:hypothetical protein